MLVERCGGFDIPRALLCDVEPLRTVGIVIPTAKELSENRVISGEDSSTSLQARTIARTVS